MVSDGFWSIDVQTSNKNAHKIRSIMQKNITSLSTLNWDDLKFFLEVARTRKASSAAKRLAVDYTTVSRRIGSCLLYTSPSPRD